MPTIADTRHSEDGFTLVELLVAISISIVVLLATLTSFDIFSSNASQQTRATDANSQVRALMDRTVADLRGASLILTAAAQDLAYSVPETPTAPATTRNRIERLCVAGDELYGWSNTVDGAPTAPTAACAAGTKVATLKSTTSTLFSYDGVSSSATPAKVRNVGLTFSLDSSTAGKTGSSTLRASAARRAAGTLATGPDPIVPTCNAAGALLSLSASLGDLGPLTVTYADDGGVSLGTPSGTTLQIPEGITHVVATITNAVGATNIVRKDVECN